MTILTQADVIRAAKLSSTPTADELLTAAEIAAAVDPVIERLSGPALTASKTYTGPCRKGAIALPWRYVSVTSVTVDGVAVAAAEYDDVTHAASGVLRAATGYAPWSYGDTVVVVAVTGTALAPGDVQLAAVSLARHWWQLNENGGRAAFETAVQSDAGVPSIVREQLVASPNLPGFG